MPLAEQLKSPDATAQPTPRPAKRHPDSPFWGVHGCVFRHHNTPERCLITTVRQVGSAADPPSRVVADRLWLLNDPHVAVLVAQAGKEDAPGLANLSPDTGDEAALLVWLNGSDFYGEHRVSRYLRQVYLSRPDLVRAFPEVPGLDTAAFHEWCREHGRLEVPIPTELLPATGGRSARVRRPKTTRAAGVNLVGFLDDARGIGEVARRIGLALDAAMVPHTDLAFGATTPSGAVQTGASGPHDLNVVCVNPDSLLNLARQTGEGFLRDNLTVGVWFWETEELPPSYGFAFDLVDEVWAATDFVAEAVRSRAKGRVPVQTITLPLVAPAVAALSELEPTLQELLQRPSDSGRTTFLSSWDYRSVAARKNPLGVIDAYVSGFPADGSARLILKCINSDADPVAHRQVLGRAAQRGDIEMVDVRLSAADNAALIAASDCYVSLHRSEGLGLNLADAMALGVPTIATAYGGNLAFMRDDDCWLIPYQLVDVGPDKHPYPFDAQWAEPDLDASTAAMLSVAADPAGASARAARARHRLLADFSIERASASLVALIDQLPRRRRLRERFGR